MVGKRSGKKVVGILFLLISVIGVASLSVNFFLSDLEKKYGGTDETYLAKGENAKDEDSKEQENNLEELLADAPEIKGLYKKTDNPRNEKELKKFVKKYGGVWYVTKEFNADKEWQYYELGKKLMLFAWNNFNDYSVDPIVGYYEIPVYEQLYINGKLIDSKQIRTDKEFIYGETQYYDGIDIDYNEKFIVLMDEEVDLSGLGGPKFSMEDFRYEKIDGFEYLISDIYGFALMWDGTYLEYCEPDTYGHYQGYYAFRYYNIDSVISQDWNDK